MGLLSDGRVGPDPYDRDNSPGSRADLNHAFLINASRCHRQGLAPALYSRDGTVAVLLCNTGALAYSVLAYEEIAELPWTGEIKRYLELLGGVCGSDTEHEASVERILSLAPTEGDKPMHHPDSRSPWRISHMARRNRQLASSASDCSCGASSRNKSSVFKKLVST
jgi:hypothetical protein